MNTDTQTWIVVADGAKARVMEYYGPDEPLVVVPDGEFSHPDLPSREIASDNRGQGYTGKGISQAGSKEFSSDPHEFEEARFIAQVSEFLNAHVTDFDQLVVAAAPKALGTLRKKVSSDVQKKISAEFDKDLAGFSLEDMRVHFKNVLKLDTRH